MANYQLIKQRIGARFQGIKDTEWANLSYRTETLKDRVICRGRLNKKIDISVLIYIHIFIPLSFSRLAICLASPLPVVLVLTRSWAQSRASGSMTSWADPRTLSLCPPFPSTSLRIISSSIRCGRDDLPPRAVVVDFLYISNNMSRYHPMRCPVEFCIKMWFLLFAQFNKRRLPHTLLPILTIPNKKKSWFKFKLKFLRLRCL